MEGLSAKRAIEGSYLVTLWPLLAQAASAALVAITRPEPDLELGAAESAGLSVTYIVLLFATATLILYLIKKGLVKLLKILLVASLFYTASISLVSIFAELGWPSLAALPLGAAAAWLGLRPGLAGNLAKAFLAASVAYMFVGIFPEVFTLIFLGMLAAYDAYAVFRGPLGKIFGQVGDSEDPLKPLMIVHGRVSMGLGDLFAYSLASASSTRMLGLPEAIVPLALLNVGVLLTLRILYSKRGALPGLTLPVLLWLLGIALIRTSRLA